MAPGATNFGNNRFALLSPSPKAKHKKPENSPLNIFPELPITKTDDPRSLVIRPLDEKKPLTTLSCFAVYKGIQAISNEVNNITELRDGSLLLLVKNKKIADKFLVANKLPGVTDITVKLHESLNCVKGTIYAPFISHLAEEDIVEGLQENGVKSAFKFSKISAGVRKYTGAILLTFDKYNLPDKIEVAWRTLSVRPYSRTPCVARFVRFLVTPRKIVATQQFVPRATSPHTLLPNALELCALTANQIIPLHQIYVVNFNKPKKYLKLKR